MRYSVTVAQWTLTPLVQVRCLMSRPNSRVNQQHNTRVNKMKRDGNIRKNYRREINLQTKQVKDRSKYRRKQKHPKKELN